VAMLGASPSSSAALKALATYGSRIISEIWRRVTWIRNSDAGFRGVILTLSAWAIRFDPHLVRVRAGTEVSASVRPVNLIYAKYRKVN
jgi:hypothetical protein